MNKQELDSLSDRELSIDPIFILGIMPRCGTNFLHDLLCLHPDCVPGGIIWEDFLLAHADLLVKYANAVYKHFNPNWKVEETLGAVSLLCKCLGDSLVSFLNLQLKHAQLSETRMTTNSKEISPKKLVTKTPSVKNLRYFFNIFPHSSLIIIVRDGRSVVESGVKTFNWNYEKAMRNWATAARTILQFIQDNQNANQKYLLVRYEDLYKHKEEELRKIFSFLDLDLHAYDFDATSNLPVRGSSQSRAHTCQHVHWEGTENIRYFNPLDRASHWNSALHERFNWIAGDSIVAFGYEKQPQAKNRFLWTIWNLLMDLKWGISLKIAPFCPVFSHTFHQKRTIGTLGFSSNHKKKSDCLP